VNYPILMKILSRILLIEAALMLAPLMAACGPETPPAGSGVIGGGG